MAVENFSQLPRVEPSGFRPSPRRAALAAVVAALGAGCGSGDATSGAESGEPVVSESNTTGGKEKCYGIAMAGKNDCADANGVHSCAGQATVNKAPTEWKYVAKGTCEKEGGKTSPPSKK